MEQNQQYQLGPWIVCSRTNSLTGNVDKHSLDNKSMQVLLFLIQHAGERVSKDQIFQNVWKGSVVADDILSVSVSKIRKALGDNARSPTFIKTLPGHGYSLIAHVEKIERTEEETRKKVPSSNIKIAAISLFFMACLVMYFTNIGSDSSKDQININSIAVLPFEDLSVTQDNQHFTDGLPDAIINQLSQIKQLKVISRYSSFTYRGNYNAAEIGQALQVDTLLDGTVQIIGEQVRIIVRIFSTANGQQLWSKTFDSEEQDIFNIQDKISSAIKATIQPNAISNMRSTKVINAQAYEWFLMGQYHWRQRNPESVAKALTFFKQSLELEPDYAEAHIGIAITYSLLHIYGNWEVEKGIEAALSHIQSALALQPDSSTALAAKGMLLSDKAFYEATINDNNVTSQLDASLYQQAEQAFIRSLELDNNATTHRWYSGLLKRAGREEEAISHLNQAIKLNPLSASLKRSISFSFEVLGKQDTAQRIFQNALSLEPNYFSKVIDSASIYRHTAESIINMAEWQVANAELFVDCSSANYCIQPILSYLSIGADKAAFDILDNMPPQNDRFRQWVESISTNEQDSERKVLSQIEMLALKYPNNRSTLFKLSTAQFRAKAFKQTQKTLLTLYPQWANEELIVNSEITADNYLALVLYAATLSHIQEKELANTLLLRVQAFLNLGNVFDKVQAEFTLAQINAQLGNNAQALSNLAAALDMGWIESYNQEWWSLQNNHLLRPLHTEPEFKLLMKKHQQKLNELRERLTQKLSLFTT